MYLPIDHRSYPQEVHLVQRGLPLYTRELCGAGAVARAGTGVALAVLEEHPRTVMRLAEVSAHAGERGYSVPS